MSSGNIKVLVVDDSSVARRMIARALNAAPDITVVGMAEGPFEARRMIRDLQPDVLTLDVVMPKMDGIAFLRSLMKNRPMPVLMVAAHCDRSKQDTLSALESGAVDFILKPSSAVNGKLEPFVQEIQAKVRIAAKANIRHLINRLTRGRRSHPEVRRAGVLMDGYRHVIAMGASTGGTEAIREVLADLPVNCPPVLMAQHIPSNFSCSFAQRLNENCEIKVVEATHKEVLKPGTAYLAPGDHHLRIRAVGKDYLCWLDQLPKVNRHRPSVDVLFDSVAVAVADGKGIGVLLTGMGSDGALGLKNMYERGFYTLAQDESSSVVWGMPGAAFKLGVVNKVLPLENIAGELLHLPRRKRNTRNAS